MTPDDMDRREARPGRLSGETKRDGSVHYRRKTQRNNQDKFDAIVSRANHRITILHLFSDHGVCIVCVSVRGGRWTLASPPFVTCRGGTEPTAAGLQNKSFEAAAAQQKLASGSTEDSTEEQLQ